MAKVPQSYEFEKLMVRIVDTSPFYAELLTNFQISEVSAIGTLGVYTKHHRIYMQYNKEFLFKYSPEIQVGLFQHEILHIMCGHLGNVKEKQRTIANVADDLSINTNLVPRKNLPPDCGAFYNEPPFALPANLTSDQYYELIMKDEKLKQQLIGGFGGSGGEITIQLPNGTEVTVSLDNHSLQKLLGDGNGGIDPNLIKEMVKRAVDKAAGNVPGELSHLVNEILQPPKVNWQREVQMFVNRNVRGDRLKSWKRENRRIPGMIKRRRRTQVPKAAFLIDASGSISDDQLNAFCNEAKHLYKHIPIYVIVFDHGIHDEYNFEGKFKEIKARGGTSFVEPFKRAEEMSDISAVVCLTDGYGTWPQGNRHKQTLWVLTKDAVDGKQIPFGRSVKIEI